MDADEIERAIEAMGFEVVVLERAGARSRPRLKIRIDRPGDTPRRSPITVEDCAAVSRRLRELLEAEGEASSLALEVSSPGVERPLVKPADYRRFAGERVRLRGYGPLADRAKQLEGRLLGLVEDRPGLLALDVGGERVEIPLDQVATARLVYAWEDRSNGDSDRR